MQDDGTNKTIFCELLKAALSLGVLELFNSLFITSVKISYPRIRFIVFSFQLIIICAVNILPSLKFSSSNNNLN